MIPKVGYWSALLTTVLTVITFGIAIATPPLSGPYCTSGCYVYPFSDIAVRFPRDYYWMYPAILFALVFYVLMVSIHYSAPKDKKILSHIGQSFALISIATLVINYFLQLSIIQPSVLSGEVDGLALLSQFNAHGIFIALEEIGFLMMSLSMVFMAPIFSRKTKIETAIRWIFIACFVLTVLVLVLYSVFYGINREYRFEVAAISINWLTLIVSGVLLSIFFKRELKYINK
jgi:hypothetical protein